MIEQDPPDDRDYAAEDREYRRERTCTRCKEVILTQMYQVGENQWEEGASAPFLVIQLFSSDAFLCPACEIELRDWLKGVAS